MKALSPLNFELSKNGSASISDRYNAYVYLFMWALHKMPE